MRDGPLQTNGRLGEPSLPASFLQKLPRINPCLFRVNFAETETYPPLNDLKWPLVFTIFCLHPSGYLQNRTRGGLRKEPPLHCFRVILLAVVS